MMDFCLHLWANDGQNCICQSPVTSGPVLLILILAPGPLLLCIYIFLTSLSFLPASEGYLDELCLGVTYQADGPRMPVFVAQHRNGLGGIEFIMGTEKGSRICKCWVDLGACWADWWVVALNSKETVWAGVPLTVDMEWQGSWFAWWSLMHVRQIEDHWEADVEPEGGRASRDRAVTKR